MKKLIITALLSVAMMGCTLGSEIYSNKSGKFLVVSDLGISMSGRYHSYEVKGLGRSETFRLSLSGAEAFEEGDIIEFNLVKSVDK